MNSPVVTYLEYLLWASVFLIFYSYSIYPVLLFIFARLFGKKILIDESYLPVIGVLVPAYNEEEVIRKKIENVLAINYPPEKISIWIGSDCSTDRTAEIVKSITDPRIHLWLAKTRGGKTGILNNLAPLVDAEIILFTDANTMHEEECLRAIARNFADKTVGAVAGHINHSTGDSSEEQYGEGIYRSFESRQKYLEGRLHSTISAFGGFYAVRKELFKSIPQNAYSNDDVLIPMGVIRQGYRVVYEHTALSWEDTTGNIASEFSRRVRIGAGNFQAFFWLIDFLNPLKGWPAFCYFSHKVTRWFSPLFFILAAVSCGLLFILGNQVIYQMLFVSGLVFLIAGLLYKVIPLRITQHIYYFLVMNMALINGFFRYLGGIKTAAWSRTDRSS